MRWNTLLFIATLVATAAALDVIVNPIGTDLLRPITQPAPTVKVETNLPTTTTPNLNEVSTERIKEVSSAEEEAFDSINAKSSIINLEPQVPIAGFEGDSSSLIDSKEGEGDDDDAHPIVPEPSEPTLPDRSVEVPSDDLIVETESGSIQGHLWRDNENIISYLDIPYGTIEHHFRAASPASPWETIHDVKEHDKRCPQMNRDRYIGDIDCLTLSIFKPRDAINASVLFHIHAENFNTGSGNPNIYGPEYLVSNGVILVLPNYRLGPLGFLCLRNATAPGNMALKDLTLALSWVHENIQAFGGSPYNIAVSGDGHSGALAGFLALSPMSKDYVSKVIAESGSFFSHWALDRNPIATADHLMNRLVELNDDPELEISLENLHIQLIVAASINIQFRPCIERDVKNTFISETPYTTITTKSFENTSFLLGSAMYAGVHEAVHQSENSIKALNEDNTLLLPNDLTFATVTLRNQAGQRVKRQYFGDEDISVDDVKNLALCFTDIGYLGPGIRSARLLVDSDATVYFYEFAYVGELNRVLQSIDHPVEGAVKGDIVGYLFTQNGVLPGEQQTAESKMVETLTEMWTQFLKTGTPSTDAIKWNQLEKGGAEEEEYLLIDSTPKMKSGVHVERLPLWTDIYDRHFIDGNHGNELSASVYTIIVLQCMFFIGFCKNASHIF